MIKKRVNAKENNFEVVLPPDGKIEKLAETLNKFPPLDFRKLIDEARTPLIISGLVEGALMAIVPAE